MSVSTVEEPVGDTDDGAREALVGRLLGALTAGAELLAVELGRRLGLYEAVHRAGSVTASSLSRHAGIGSRYAREWLEQQAVAGYLVVAEETGEAETRRFALPTAGVDVLLEPDNPNAFIGAASTLAGLGTALPAVVEAFRTGNGVPFHHYGAEMRHGIGSVNRPGFRHSVGGWVRALPSVVARLDSGGAVLDAGCGTGWSSIALAQAFPLATVHGVDMDEASVAEAVENARAEGVSDRVRFTVGNVAAPAVDPSRYDLVCVFEALHDMGDPVGALAAFRAQLADGGAVLVADERVAERFGAPADDWERLLYAMSVLHCLPATTAESGPVANGTVLRASTVREWVHRAGFSSVAELAVEHDFWRFYQIR